MQCRDECLFSADSGKSRAFAFGATALPEYDGSDFAKNQDVIVVSLAYRLNVFGFPMAEDLAPQYTNLGFLDQELAFQWVQNNIAQFGGDPQKVTIMVRSHACKTISQRGLLAPEGSICGCTICFWCVPPAQLHRRTLPRRHHAFRRGDPHLSRDEPYPV